MKIKEILEVTGGELVSGDKESEIGTDTISDDSRKIRPGECFIALNGSNFKGDDFVPDAFGRGAVGAIVSRNIHLRETRGRTVIKVRDTLKALQDISSAQRAKFDIPVVGVTGSNGKTTVKEMIWKILSTRYSVLKSEGTKNNHIGLPQTLLKLDKDHDVCVLELGANHKGEIRLLSGIARPTIAVITNIGHSHLKFFGNIEGVLDTKKEILESLDRRKAVAVLNGDDKYLSRLRLGTLRTIRFGIGASNDYSASMISVDNRRIRFRLNGRQEFVLNLLGRHNVHNALAAIAVSSVLNISSDDMRQALSEFEPATMRLSIRSVNGVDIINDSYNSNPTSMMKALDVIAHYPARSKWIVSGDMLELGRRGIDFHKKIGTEIGRTGINGLLTLGKLSRYMSSEASKNGMANGKTWHCSSHDEIAAILKDNIKPGDVVLLKGSRGMRMEEVLGKLGA